VVSRQIRLLRSNSSSIIRTRIQTLTSDSASNHGKLVGRNWDVRGDDRCLPRHHRSWSHPLSQNSVACAETNSGTSTAHAGTDQRAYWVAPHLFSVVGYEQMREVMACARRKSGRQLPIRELSRPPADFRGDRSYLQASALPAPGKPCQCFANDPSRTGWYGDSLRDHFNKGLPVRWSLPMCSIAVELVGDHDTFCAVSE
jgi:hypothetical protein